jgi:hypothetical protein
MLSSESKGRNDAPPLDMLTVYDHGYSGHLIFDINIIAF